MLHDVSNTIRMEIFSDSPPKLFSVITTKWRGFILFRTSTIVPFSHVRLICVLTQYFLLNFYCKDKNDFFRGILADKPNPCSLRWTVLAIKMTLAFAISPYVLYIQIISFCHLCTVPYYFYHQLLLYTFSCFTNLVL